MTKAIVDMEYVACNLCGMDDPVLVYRKRGKTIPIVYDIVKCRNCGLIYVNPRLTPIYKEKLYTDNYYEGKGFDAYFIGSTQKKEENAQLLVRCIKDAILKDREKPKLLEIGGGGGINSLLCFKNRL